MMFSVALAVCGSKNELLSNKTNLESMTEFKKITLTHQGRVSVIKMNHLPLNAIAELLGVLNAALDSIENNPYDQVGDR